MRKKKKIEQEELTTGGREGFSNNNDYIPEEIISDILLRLPAKTLTRFKTACKQWLSLISHPSFARLHFCRNSATSAGLFIHARNIQARQHYILTAAHPHGGGPLILLHTIDDVNYDQIRNTRTEHLIGLVLFACDDFAYVINPTTRQVFKLPFSKPAAAPNNVNFRTSHRYNFFGFDQSQNQHKVLHMRVLRRRTKFKVFSLSDYSWRKLDNLTLPVDVNVNDILTGIHSVCVNSVIHVMIPFGLKRMMLTFDLITECFLVINLPADLPSKSYIKYHIGQHATRYRSNFPFLTQINGGLLLGLVCHDDRLAQTNHIHIWILQDYENHGVWVRKTITLSTNKSWIELGEPLPLDFCNDNEFVFSFGNRLPKEKNAISVPIYDLKNASFKSLNFFIGDHQVLCSENVEFIQYKSYVENISPLINNIKLQQP